MATINLRDYYPFYHDDAWIEISDELAREMKAWERDENNYKRKCRYHGHYSLMHAFNTTCATSCCPVCRINRLNAFTLTTFLG